MTQTISLEELLLQVGSTLRHARKNKDEKMDTVAHATGISKSVISEIENGHHPSLRVSDLLKLTTHYGIALAEVLGGNKV